MKKDILLLICFLVVVAISFCSITFSITKAFVASVNTTVDNYDVFGNGTIKNLP